MSKGSRYERELKKELDALGLSSARIGASGAGTDDDLPDVIGIGDTGVLVIEAKYRTKPYLALSDDEIDALVRFASPKRCIPLVAFRRPREPWLCFEVPQLNVRDCGYSVTQEVYDRGKPLKWYARKILNSQGGSSGE